MCKALSFVDACTEEHLAAMSRQFPPPASAGRGPRFFICAGELNSPGISFASGKTLVRATRRGRLIHSLNEVCL